MDAVLDWLLGWWAVLTQHKDAFEFLKDVLEFLVAAGTIATIVVAPAIWLWRRLRKPRQPDPKLSPPPQADHSLARYSARAVELLGRDEALARLRGFLQSDGGFAWMQVAGPGGQGKSRLGYELTLWAQDQGWQAGLLETADLAAFEAHWAEWQPRRPHLLVLDYVIGREAGIKPLIQTLAARATALRRPVRLLFLERQRWDRGGLGAISQGSGATPALGTEGRAEWFLKLAERHDGNDQTLQSCRYEDGLLELERLEPTDLVTIVRRLARLEGAEIALSDRAIAERLAHIDSAGRPLWAYFLGQALAAGADPAAGPAGPGWHREDLLEATLNRDWGSRWQRSLGGAAPTLGEDSPAQRIAAAATIGGGLDCSAAARRGLIPSADAETRRRALVMTDAPLDRGAAGPARFIPPLQPDLLGEWFVLSAFTAGLPAAEVLDLAWQLAADPTAAFLVRLSQDFPDHPVTADLLGRDPPDAPAKEALVAAAPAMVVYLSLAKRPVPPPVTDAWTAAVEAALTAPGRAQAIANLGPLYEQAQHAGRDLKQAMDPIWWRRQGSAAGDEETAAGLHRLQAVQRLLAPPSAPDTATADWATRRSVDLGRVPWADTPPIPGDWEDLDGTEAAAVLTRLRAPLTTAGLDDAPAGPALQRLRRMPLTFYRHCALVDLQWHRPGQETPTLVCALVSPGGAALLDGRPNLLYAINPDLLVLSGEESAEAYLRFFTTFLRGEEGPFQIIEDAAALLPAEFCELIGAPPLRGIDGDLETDGWRRIEASVLYGNVLLQITFKVMSSGMVEMEYNNALAWLSVHRRHYDGIFRTPLSETASG